MSFGFSKEPTHFDGSFKYPQLMFLMRNKKKYYSKFCVKRPLKYRQKKGFNDKWASAWDFQQSGLCDQPAKPQISPRISAVWFNRRLHRLVWVYSCQNATLLDGSLMKVESIAECYHWSIRQYFWPALSDNLSCKPIFGLFESSRFRQIYYISLRSLIWRPAITLFWYIMSFKPF